MIDVAPHMNTDQVVPKNGLAIVQLECGLSEPIVRTEYPEFPLTLDSLHFTAEGAERADWVVATFEIKHSFATRVPRERRILVLTEPVPDLPAGYVNQFGILVAPQLIRSFSGIWHRSHAALPSTFARDVTRPGHASVYTYADLVALRPPQKRDAITVVVSGKTLFPGHRRRLQFLRLLKDAIGDHLEVYGDGLRKIPIKADAILPYKYHLVLENTVMPSYWTEKLADAYLGYALPVVSSPNNLAEWFPEESFVPIDIDDPARAIATIKAVLDDDIYERRLPAIVEARDRLLRNERLCPLIARVIAAFPNSAAPLAAARTITPAPKLPPLARILREIRRSYWKLDGRLRRR